MEGMSIHGKSIFVLMSIFSMIEMSILISNQNHLEVMDNHLEVMDNHLHLDNFYRMNLGTVGWTLKILLVIRVVLIRLKRRHPKEV